jgi:hypothetical protein
MEPEGYREEATPEAGLNGECGIGVRDSLEKSGRLRATVLYTLPHFFRLSAQILEV